MATSSSPNPADHTGHNIQAQPTGQNYDIERELPGNAWCFTCNVPVAAIWTYEHGLQPVLAA
jgi:hypothetical protein